MIVSHETFQGYLDILEKWNKRINIVKYSSKEELIKRHVLDSCQLSNYIDFNSKIIDVGSGGGFPGVILGILGYDITLIESDERKAAFLRYVIQELSLRNIRLINDRVELVQGVGCDVLVCRAFAVLEKIFELTSKISIKEKYVLLKGKSYKEEIKLAEREWLFNIEAHDSISDDGGKILEIYNLRKHGS